MSRFLFIAATLAFGQPAFAAALAPGRPSLPSAQKCGAFSTDEYGTVTITNPCVYVKLQPVLIDARSYANDEGFTAVIVCRHYGYPIVHDYKIRFFQGHSQSNFLGFAKTVPVTVRLDDGGQPAGLVYAGGGNTPNTRAYLFIKCGKKIF